MVRIEGEIFEVWCSTDSLVLKAVSIVLSRQWHGLLSKRCFHLRGRGGSKAAVPEVLDKIHPVSTSPESGSNQTAARYVFKSDVKRYYASMDHEILIDQCRELIDDETIFDLVRQYIRRCVSDGGVYHEVTQGIPLGCSLSPLMGAIYLRPLDEAMEKAGLFYAQYMDDWIVFAPTRWKLRKVIRITNRVLNQLKVWQHPDKTFIGRAEKGFKS